MPLQFIRRQLPFVYNFGVFSDYCQFSNGSPVFSYYFRCIFVFNLIFTRLSRSVWWENCSFVFYWMLSLIRWSRRNILKSIYFVYINNITFIIQTIFINMYMCIFHQSMKFVTHKFLYLQTCVIQNIFWQNQFITFFTPCSMVCQFMPWKWLFVSIWFWTL